MKHNVLVSDRGQITLPAPLRKRLGIQPGGVIVLEERDGELVLKPAAVVEIRTYSEEDIVAWVEADVLSEEERRAFLETRTDPA